MFVCVFVFHLFYGRFMFTLRRVWARKKEKTKQNRDNHVKCGFPPEGHPYVKCILFIIYYKLTQVNKLINECFTLPQLSFFIYPTMVEWACSAGAPLHIYPATHIHTWELPSTTTVWPAGHWAAPLVRSGVKGLATSLVVMREGRGSLHYPKHTQYTVCKEMNMTLSNNVKQVVQNTSLDARQDKIGPQGLGSLLWLSAAHFNNQNTV